MGQQNYIGSLRVTMFKMLTWSVLQQPAHEIIWQNHLKHGNRMNCTSKIQYIFLFLKERRSGVFAMTSISEYKVSGLMDEACGCRDFLIKTLLKAGPSWAACMNSITFCTIISPVKVSMTSNPKTVPQNNIDMTENRSSWREGQRQVVWMKTFPILHADLKHFSWGKRK